MEQIDTEDYIKGHISRVRKHINTFIQLLIRRAANHDKSKLDENDEDVSYNLWEMIDFVGSLKENTMENKNQLFESLLQIER